MNIVTQVLSFLVEIVAPHSFQKQASDVGWGDGILLQEVDVPGVGRTDGEGLGAAPTMPPTRGLLVSIHCPPSKAAGQRFGRKDGTAGVVVGKSHEELTHPTWEFSRMGWGSVQGGRCRLKK